MHARGKRANGRAINNLLYTSGDYLRCVKPLAACKSAFHGAVMRITLRNQLPRVSAGGDGEGWIDREKGQVANDTVSRTAFLPSAIETLVDIQCASRFAVIMNYACTRASSITVSRARAENEFLPGGDNVGLHGKLRKPTQRAIMRRASVTALPFSANDHDERSGCNSVARAVV